MKQANLSRLTASLSDLVAYGEVSYSGRVPTTGSAGVEVAALITELRALKWIPAARNDVAAWRHEVTPQASATFTG